MVLNDCVRPAEVIRAELVGCFVEFAFDVGVRGRVGEIALVAGIWAPDNHTDEGRYRRRLPHIAMSAAGSLAGREPLESISEIDYNLFNCRTVSIQILDLL